MAKLLVVIQIALSAAVLWLAREATFDYFTAPASDPSQYFAYGLAFLFGLGFEATWRSKTELRVYLQANNLGSHHGIALRQTAFACGALLAYLAAFKDTNISRVYILLSTAGVYTSLVATSYFLPPLLARYVFDGVREERILLVGPASKLHPVTAWLKSKEALGFRMLGYVTENDADIDEDEELPHLGNVGQLEYLLDELHPTQLLLLQLPHQYEDHRHIINLAENHCARVVILNNLAETLRHPVVYFEDEGFNFIGLRHEPLENPFNRLLKRAFDIAISLPVVLFILPFLSAIVWLLHRWQSPGPLFFRQQRAGLLNQRFMLVKFRSMHLGHPDPARQAVQNDHRVFSAGRWLRKLSIDEMPQFWNVLTGEMSIVGPRPHMLQHNEEFARQLQKYHVRASVKPGITGLAQVRGFRGEIRSERDLRSRLVSDLTYLEHWTLGTDFLVVVQTIWQVFFPPPSAY